jgi:outer membrane protein assembly factor BamB
MQRFLLLGVWLVASQTANLAAEPGKESLWAAAKQGDAKEVERLLTAGIDVNARTDYGVTALFYAAEKGHLDLVRILIAHQAEVNVTDTFYKSTPLRMAAANRHTGIVKELIENGASDAGTVVPQLAAWADADLVRAALEKGKPTPATLTVALKAAKDRPEIAQLLEQAGATIPAAAGGPVPAELIAAASGLYHNLSGFEYGLAAVQDKFVLTLDGKPTMEFLLAAPDSLVAIDDPSRKLTFRRQNERIIGFDLVAGEASVSYVRSEAPQALKAKDPVIDGEPGQIIPRNWPSFRGPQASGIADDQWPPISWDVGKGMNVRWKTAVGGLGHAGPIIWGDRIYITTAVRKEGKAELKVGLYGNVESVEDQSEHSWRVLCLNAQNGQILWEQTAHEGVPRTKRHTKATHANCTPATNGECVVANFGSEGLYCYGTDGGLKWRRDLGSLHSGWFFNADVQWGFASSPIIYRDLVIVQCDVGAGSFLAAYWISDGSEVWRTDREEIPSWGTPTIVESPERVELVTSATRFARGYDPLTGAELWRLGRFSEITVPTPVYGEGLIFITSGYRPIQPIFAVRPGAIGDVSPAEGQTKSESVAWAALKGGPYMQTPLVYRGCFYVCSDAGVVTCYEAASGKQIYMKRLPGGGAHTASPVAADGRLYFTGEAGRIHVVQAGGEFSVLAENELGETCLATPAISNGMIVFRTESHLLAIGRPAKE